MATLGGGAPGGIPLAFPPGMWEARANSPLGSLPRVHPIRELVGPVGIAAPPDIPAPTVRANTLVGT